MKSKTDLFRLIRAMSRSEKRYFAIDAQKAGKKNAKYLALFKLINAMEEYDESKLKAKFPKHLSVDKAYLYDAILRSMRDYHSKKSRAAQIKEKILDAKYLYERELYDLCEESLGEAKSLAEDLGDNLALLEINKQERRLVRSAKKKELPIHVPVLVDAKEQNIQALQEEMVYLDLYDEIAKRFIERRKPDEAFNEELEDLLKKDETSLVSILATRRFYQCKGLQHQILGDFDTVFDYYNKVINWWDNNPKYKEEEFYNYVIDASNFLAICFKKDKYERIKELIFRLETEKPNNPHHQKVLFQRLYQFKLVSRINLGIVDDLDKLAKEIKEGLQSFTLHPHTQKILTSNIAILFFIAERFDCCIEWCDYLINDRKNTARLDINRAIYFLKLIASYEADEFDVLESTVRTTYRSLSKMEREDDIHYNSLLKGIKKLFNAPLNEFKNVLSGIEEGVTELRGNSKQRVPLGIDELIMWWIQSKKQHQSIVSIVQRKTY